MSGRVPALVRGVDAAEMLGQVLDLMRQHARGELAPVAVVEYLGALMEDVYGVDWVEPDQRPRVEFYTSAPEAYDGFGTRTLRTSYGVGIGGKRETWRRVSVVVEHESWQRMRYDSGFYAVVEDEAFGLRIARGQYMPDHTPA